MTPSIISRTIVSINQGDYMTTQEIQNYRSLIGSLNNHSANIHSDHLTITGFFTTIHEYSLHTVKLLKNIPTEQLDAYKDQLEACNYDLDFIKSLRNK